MKIADVQIKRIQHRLKDHNIELKLTKEAVDFIATAGFDPVYGARPLKRAIQQYLENPLAQDILAGKFASGDVISVSCAGGVLVFS